MTKIITKHFDEPRLHELETYRKLGGYVALKKALSMKPAEIADEVKKSNLRGLGGAGFYAAVKWGTLPPLDKVPGPRYVVGNCDESEPGCFRDRVHVERAPHQVLEGLLIVSYAVGAGEAFIFIRGEYGRQHRVLRAAVEEARAAGLIGDKILGSPFSCNIMLMRGAGTYISGLDTALLESMEGKKSWPRQPPPFPTNFGLMGFPTVVHNVATLAMVPHIVANGGEWFAKIGTPKCGGTMLYSVSGHVEKPGVYELPMGATLRALLDAAGGVRKGRRLKAVIPGGTSTPPLGPEHLDLPLDFETVRAQGSGLGAGGVIVLDETADMVEVCRDIIGFLTHESCGQCTPCREGSAWTKRILERMLSGRGLPGDPANLERIAGNVTGKTICALGDTVGIVLKAYLTKFREEFRRLASPAGKQAQVCRDAVSKGATI
ncbi:MAG: NADH-quinone oxidoreductase subunit NuoF [Elusimicrobia bacterium]|nr:NADH-quinone oxidoreductase subunit NuoF [Elusimicrobiota bacterium]